jgi:nucleotide-binding universal stress UspA family protein
VAGATDFAAGRRRQSCPRHALGAGDRRRRGARASGRALDRLRGLARASDPVIVGTVYDPSDGTSQVWRAGLPPWPDVAAVLVELNHTQKAVAAEHDALVADIRQRFVGHGLQAGNPAQPNPRPQYRAFGTATSMEPNARAPTPSALASGQCCKRTANRG